MALTTIALAASATPGASPVAMSRRARRLAQASAPVTDDAPAEPVSDGAPDAVVVDEPPAVIVVEEAVGPVADDAPAVPVFDGASSVDAPVGGAEDAFARASDAFGFSPVDEQSEVPVAEERVVVGAAPALTHVAPRPRLGRRLVAAGASLGVMGVAGLIAVSMTVPASAVAAVQGDRSAPAASLIAADAAPPKKVDDDEIQAFVASAGVEDEALARDGEFSTVSLLDVAAEEHITFSDSLYSNDPNAAIQWPFMVGVAMSSPYGMRNGRLHAGIDLVPGSGATIQAIADGTVRIATESGGAYGVTAYVDHVIDGKVITSHYSHMQYGSLHVKAGQKVKVGDTIGKVGNTGRSYGAHLHFELIVNGSTIDPLPWMRDNAGRYSY
ncbi:peptidoglycan DD-metalloendopeptidase family protein [Microbacterium sp. NPDC058342]|uniref:peptidoglycan DD-metalloendopeptidase family protein n=1 Tax=Microbacterium sp. NPDC058342 TaxID=3346454 RepID=UPI0036630D8C